MSNFAQRLAAVRGEEGGSFEDRLLAVRGGLSVADVARSRLESRGLTPETAKLGAPMSQLPANHEMGAVLAATKEALGMDDGTGFRTELKTVDGGLGSQLADKLNPVNVAKGIGTQAFRTGQDIIDPLGVAHEGGLNRMAGDLRGMVPDLPSIARESYRRGEAGESTVGMYAEPLAQGVMLAGGMGASKLMKGGAAGIAKADTKYAAAVDQPLTATIREMIERKQIVNDPTAIAKRSGAAEARAIAERDATAPMKTTEAGDPSAQARGVKRRTLAEQAQIEGNIKTIAEALDAKNTPKNVLTGAVKAGAVAAAAPAMVGMFKTAALIGKSVAIFETVRNLPKTYAWKTASALAKRQFSEALAKGDEIGASEIGVGIATGQLVDDDFSHRGFIQSLMAETEALPSPDLRRQVVASKRIYYTDPDGREIDIPRTVASQLASASNVNEASSPVSAWLDAMAKQGQLKRGGTISAR